MANFNNILNKLKGFAQKNPDKARDVLEKVEGAVNSKTGGKYSDKLNQASEAAKGGLGIPTPAQGQNQPGQVPGQAPGQTTPGQVPEPGQAPQPGQAPGQPPQGQAPGQPPLQ